MNPIHILKTGHYTDMYGRHYQFSEADLNDIMQTYDPTLHEAPIVVGHPRSDGPAYGWVGGVKRGNDGLSVEPRDVEPQFAELVKTRRYSKVSACLYGPDTPGNPTPGKYYLRHVGFLGAQPPAIKGLKPVTFADAGEDLIELSEWSQQTTASLFSRIRDFIISQFGLEKANSVVPDYMIDSLRDDASRTPASPASAFSDPAGSPAEDVIQPTPEPVRVVITLVFRELHTATGAIQALDETRCALAGFRPEGCHAPYVLVSEKCLGFASGVWMFALVVQARTMFVQDDPPEAEGVPASLYEEEE